MLINEREAKMIQAVIDRETLSMDMVSRDIIRVNIFKTFVTSYRIITKWIEVLKCFVKNRSTE